MTATLSSGGRDEPQARHGFHDPRMLARLGAAGSLALLIGSLGAGVMPGYDLIAHVPVLSVFRSGPLGLRAAMGLVYVGLALMIGAWLLIGRALLDPARRAEIDLPLLRRTLLLWAIPLLACAPLFSRDLYAYAAQAQLAHAGLNPYRATPADLPGRFLDEVAWRWVDSPAPYGPLWLMLGRLVAATAGEGVLRTVIGIRLLCAAGFALMVWLLPRLARLAGGRAELALWLGALNPLVLIQFVAGGHNDALMIGLGVAGLTLAASADGQTPGDWRMLRHWGGWRGDPARLAGGSALIAAAIAVKSPAAVMLAFAPLLWLRRRGRIDDPGEWALSCLIAVGSAAAAFAALTGASGLGLGWVTQVYRGIPTVNW
ncbi:MAG: polyprenol phosphomannose-dependent alpha 1,6 mannosyltransferase MptB, partial [Frankiaceae bacterium]|nr:polyprenol phosphomannose-dependent alpha 1,6 mannosyltransferase MptB [Frankiaceae bacterium]